MTTVDRFKAKAPGIMAQLIIDFQLTPQEAAAIVGNLGHESGGLETLQEIKPIVKGSAGGYGWAQWTGPRRRAYEAFCARTGRNPASDDANYAFLWRELTGIEGSEGGALRKLRNAPANIEDKVKAFELAFLRAHKDYKHYPSRVQWANRALEAWRAVKPGIPIPTPTAKPESPAPVAKKGGSGVVGIVGVVLLIIVALAVWYVGFRR